MKIENLENQSEMKTNKCPEFPFFGATYPDARFYSFGTYTEKDFKQNKIQKF